MSCSALANHCFSVQTTFCFLFSFVNNQSFCFLCKLCRSGTLREFSDCLWPICNIWELNWKYWMTLTETELVDYFIHTTLPLTMYLKISLSFFHVTANTALVYHHGQLLALQETDKPCMPSTNYLFVFFFEFFGMVQSDRK